MKQIKDYTIEELRKLYKSYTLYMFTEYLKRAKTTQNKEIVTELYFDEGYEKPKPKTITGVEAIMQHLREEYDKNLAEYNRAKEEGRKPSYNRDTKITNEDLMRYNYIVISNLEDKLEDAELEDKPLTHKRNLNNKIYYYKICNEVIYWQTGVHEKRVEEAENNDKDEWLDSLEDRYREYHMHDEFDIESDLPTKEEIYKFIWETLRFCSVYELKQLLNNADKKFDISPAHRPRNNKKIYKYNKEGKLIDTFENRAECIEKDSISKANLSKVISGRLKTYKGFIYKED